MGLSSSEARPHGGPQDRGTHFCAADEDGNEAELHGSGGPDQVGRAGLFRCAAEKNGDHDARSEPGRWAVVAENDGGE